MNCREALAKLYDYLDKELNEDDQKGLERHLEHCSDCLKKYELEEEFNTFVRKKIACNPDVTQLKDRIRQQIDKIDSAAQPRNIMYLLVPLVAAVIIAFVIFVPWGKNSDPQAVLLAVQPLADEHTKCLQNLINFDVQSTDPNVVKASMATIPDIPDELFKPSTPDIGIHAAGVVHLSSGDKAHLDYTAYGEDVSVFVLPQGTIDKKPFKKVNHEGEAYYTGSCPYYHYVIWTCDEAECVAVSKLAPDKLLEFALNY